MSGLSITITPTAEVVVHQGIVCRVWDGTTAGGARCHLLVAGVSVHKSEDTREFDAALVEMVPVARLDPERN